jgi:hypothetical protein
MQSLRGQDPIGGRHASRRRLPGVGGVECTVVWTAVLRGLRSARIDGHFGAIPVYVAAGVVEGVAGA